MIINIIIIFIFICLFLLLNKKQEIPKQEIQNIKSIDYYVITMFSPDRINNIHNQINKIKNSGTNIDMIYVQAVIGKNLDINDLIYNKVLTPNIYENKDDKFTKVFEKRKNEIGCYLSHMRTYNMIKNKGNIDGYSIIFEDDFEITKDYSKILEETLLKLEKYDFDMLFLGINGYAGNKIIDNVYYTTKESFETHAYLVNNKNIDKIINNMTYMDGLVDVSIFKKGDERKLNVFRIYPTIVTQGGFGTTIR